MLFLLSVVVGQTTLDCGLSATDNLARVMEHIILLQMWLLLVVSVALPTVFGQPQVSECCKKGKEAVASKSDVQCDASTAALMVSRSDEMCSAIWKACCLGAKRKTRCETGAQKARENANCLDLKSGGKENEAEYCCDCCRVGFTHGLALRDCNIPLLDTTCSDKARSCCVDIKRDSKLRALISGDRPSGMKTCKDRPCSHICVTTATGYRCICRNGYVLQADGTTCKDGDECAADPNRCGEHGTCVNLFGGYYCKCKAGYKLSVEANSCEDRDECAESRPCSHGCRNTVGSFGCTCPIGYLLGADRRTCARIDLGSACKNNPCQYKCQALGNTRYQCICPSGYRLASDYRTCRDINECSERPGLCGADSRCFNTYGNYKCVSTKCPQPYFRRVGQRYCIKSTCAVGNAECENDRTYSYQWLPSAQISGLEPRSVEFYYSLVQPSFAATVRFEIAKGNEDDAFYLEQSGSYKVFIRNRKRLVGPKDYKIELHINLYTEGKLYTRLVNIFYIYVSPHNFR